MLHLPLSLVRGIESIFLMKPKKYPPNSSIYNTTNFDYKATYEKLRTTLNNNIQSLDKSEKGHILCQFKQPETFILISPKGKVIVYYDQYDDLNKVIRILEESMVCDGFLIEKDIPRTHKAIQDGIEASLDELINPELLGRLGYDNYIISTAPEKTYKAWAEGIRNYLTMRTERLECKQALEEMENSSEWLVTFGVTFTTKILRRTANYAQACDRLTEKLTSALRESPYGFKLLYDEDGRSGEGLSLRYIFVWRPADGPLELPQYPEYWEILELVPFKSIYPDSDFNDLYEDNDLH
jgi:hypothetical protein